jgi:hypothetical protein
MLAMLLGEFGSPVAQQRSEPSLFDRHVDRKALNTEEYLGEKNAYPFVDGCRSQPFGPERTYSRIVASGSKKPCGTGGRSSTECPASRSSGTTSKDHYILVSHDTMTRHRDRFFSLPITNSIFEIAVGFAFLGSCRSPQRAATGNQPKPKQTWHETQYRDIWYYF